MSHIDHWCRSCRRGGGYQPRRPDVELCRTVDGSDRPLAGQMCPRGTGDHGNERRVRKVRLQERMTTSSAR